MGHLAMVERRYQEWIFELAEVVEVIDSGDLFR